MARRAHRRDPRRRPHWRHQAAPKLAAKSWRATFLSPPPFGRLKLGFVPGPAAHPHHRRHRRHRPRLGRRLGCRRRYSHARRRAHCRVARRSLPFRPLTRNSLTRRAARGLASRASVPSPPPPPPPTQTARPRAWAAGGTGTSPLRSWVAVGHGAGRLDLFEISMGRAATPPTGGDAGAAPPPLPSRRRYRRTTRRPPPHPFLARLPGVAAHQAGANRRKP